NKIKTTLKLSAAYTLMQREQFLNTNLAEVNNRNLSIRLALESEVTDWLSTSYNSNFSFLQTSVAGRDFNEIRNQQHLLDLSFFPADNQFFSLKSEYYFNNISVENRNSYFLNLAYQYTFEKRKIDLAASWNNVLGTNEFVNVSANEFSYVQSTFRLRPSQLLVSLKFTL